MNPSDEDREYAAQTEQLRRHFEPVMTEPIPARMYLRRPAWIDYARAAVLVAVGIAIGLAIPRLLPHESAGAIAIVPLQVRAARAHMVYSPEVRHPVEVEASDQDHLVKWLSKRLDYKLKIPLLTAQGFDLLGGRLLPGPEGPVAQFMYQDPTGKRLTLYVTRRNKQDNLTAFRFAQEGKVSVFYWIDRDCGYALSGEIDRPALSQVANSVYSQLER
jgi:anti-sigma factor RsiW